ncbi:hypothetical protein MUN88_21220 [Gracilibacillus caseinilyticus]|uniref:TRAP-type C4-dicarboxylate transport system, small permease component n=1 Tax=Gracilibacillus caseinilyticus TaxID=2932256 RepID=A0ABY4EVS6_9BACI|nr:DUF6773 family protein [Gracilibacillus caseinilyticus]UOQ48517.1 hypothetical protein MUN88_21220 [Gracilibacillus caseinilyticus]
MFFKKGSFQDERVTNEQNKIYRELYVVIYLVCLVSAIYKTFKYGISMEYVATELIIFIVAGAYYAVRVVQKGLFTSEVELHDHKHKWSFQAKTVISGIVFGLVIALVFGVNSAVQYADSRMEEISFFFISFAGSLMIYLPFLLIGLIVSYQVAKTKSDKAVAKQLKEEDE